MLREPRMGGGAEAQEGVPPATADMCVWRGWFDCMMY